MSEALQAVTHKRSWRQHPSIVAGESYGLWTALEEAAPKIPKHGYPLKRWLCECACGTRRSVDASSLKRGSSHNCGCLRLKAVSERNRTHGATTADSPYYWEYKSWSAMKNRCSNPRSIDWPNYGGRGIRVSERWLGTDGLMNFVRDVGKRPSQKYSLERIDPNGHYEPGNCRWATSREQARNKRTTRWVVVGGQRMTLSDAAERADMSPYKLWQRLDKGMTPDEALSATPPRKTPKKDMMQTVHLLLLTVYRAGFYAGRVSANSAGQPPLAAPEAEAAPPTANPTSPPV